MCKTFLHSGSLGDIVYSLPTIKAMGGGRLYVKRALFHDGYDQFTAAEDLLAQQPYLFDVQPYPAQYDQFQYDPNIRIDFDLDQARRQPRRGVVHIVKRHMDAFGVRSATWRKPWLTVNGPAPVSFDYDVIHLTPRYRNDSRVDWRKVLAAIPGLVFFIGFEREYRDFIRTAGKVEYIPTRNLLEMAQVIKGSRALFCNQSVALTIAQGLGHPYFLERHPRRTNCLLYTLNEHIL